MTGKHNHNYDPHSLTQCGNYGRGGARNNETSLITDSPYGVLQYTTASSALSGKHIIPPY